MSIFVKEYGRLFCEQLSLLKTNAATSTPSSTSSASSLFTGMALADLDIVCEEEHVKVHKVVLAAASRFFRERLCKANVLGPVIIRLEDFGLSVKRDALLFIIEFVYKGGEVRVSMNEHHEHFMHHIIQSNFELFFL